MLIRTLSSPGETGVSIAWRFDAIIIIGIGGWGA